MARSPNRKDLNRDDSTHGGLLVCFDEDTWKKIAGAGKINLDENIKSNVQKIVSQYSYDKTFYDESSTREALSKELKICIEATSSLHYFFGANVDALTTERSQIVDEIKKNMQGGEVAFAHFYQRLSDLREAIGVSEKRFSDEAVQDKGGRSSDLSLDRFLVGLDKIYQQAGGMHGKLKASFVLTICEALPVKIRPDVSPYHESLVKRINRAHENLEKAGHNPAKTL